MSPERAYTIREDGSTNPGLVGLQAEIRATPSDQLAEQASLLIELPPALQPLGWHRLRLALWELRSRLSDERRAAA